MTDVQGKYKRPTNKQILDGPIKIIMLNGPIEIIMFCGGTYEQMFERTTEKHKQ